MLDRERSDGHGDLPARDDKLLDRDCERSEHVADRFVRGGEQSILDGERRFRENGRVERVNKLDCRGSDEDVERGGGDKIDARSLTDLSKLWSLILGEWFPLPRSIAS